MDPTVKKKKTSTQTSFSFQWRTSDTDSLLKHPHPHHQNNTTNLRIQRSRGSVSITAGKRGRYCACPSVLIALGIAFPVIIESGQRMIPELDYKDFIYINNNSFLALDMKCFIFAHKKRFYCSSTDVEFNVTLHHLPAPADAPVILYFWREIFKQLGALILLSLQLFKSCRSHLCSFI